jgi:hypothetical protein
VDLDALVVVRLAEASARMRAAVRLLRSGAFGLVAMDLGPAGPAQPPPSAGREAQTGPPSARREAQAALLSKLGQLAQHHDTAVCCLTVKRPEWASLGALVSLRGEALRRRTGEDRFACTVRALKDKRNAPGWTHEEAMRGAPGLP